MLMSDLEAMDVIGHWMADNDPVLTGNIPNWVWSLVNLLDDVLEATGRNGQ